MRIGDRDITMLRGWIAQYKDGRVLCEEDMPWTKLPNKRGIERLILRWDERWWSFDNKENYAAPTRREMININLGRVGAPAVHSRTIGYYDSEEKCKVILRVEEATGKATYETVPF